MRLPAGPRGKFAISSLKTAASKFVSCSFVLVNSEDEEKPGGGSRRGGKKGSDGGVKSSLAKQADVEQYQRKKELPWSGAGYEEETAASLGGGASAASATTAAAAATGVYDDSESDAAGSTTDSSSVSGGGGGYNSAKARRDRMRTTRTTDGQPLDSSDVNDGILRWKPQKHTFVLIQGMVRGALFFPPPA